MTSKRRFLKKSLTKSVNKKDMTRQHTYKKVANDTFIPERESPNPVYLSEKKARLQELKEVKAAQEPTDSELLEWAKQNHPYYQDDKEITELEEFVNYLESIE